MIKKVFLYVVVSLVISLVGVPYAYAIGNGDISISPTTASDPNDPRTESWFIYTKLPGTVHKDFVSVRNESDQTRTVKLFAVDGYTTDQGGFALRSPNDPKTGVGAWTVLSKSELTLAPDEEQSVEFTYTVPANAEPGEYAGGIVAEDTQSIQGQGVLLYKRVGVRVYHTVPGDRNERITLVSSNMVITETGRYFEVTLENAGNVSIPLKFKETISKKDGTLVATVESPEQVVLPKSKVTFKTSEWTHPLVGSFVTKGAIEKEGSLMGDAPGYSFMIVNPFLMGAGVLGLLLMVAAVILVTRRKKSSLKHKRRKK